MVVEAVSYETVRQNIEANALKPWLREQWCIPPEADATFVWQMENVLEVYTRPDDPARPHICLDETSRQVLADARPPLPPAPGWPAREDAEYVREGVVDVFLVCEPLRGWQQVRVSNQRTRLDWVACIKDLVDIHYLEAERLVLVMDNLNIHSPAEAKRLADKLEIHHTPRLAAG